MFKVFPSCSQSVQARSSWRPHVLRFVSVAWTSYVQNAEEIWSCRCPPFWVSFRDDKTDLNVSIAPAVSFLLYFGTTFSFSSFLTSLYNSSWIYICDTVASWDGEVLKTKSSLSDVANNLLVLEVGVRIGYCYWVTHFLSVFNAIVASLTLKSLMSRSITTVLTLIMWTRFIICYAAYWLYCSVKYCWSSSALQTTV